MPKIKCNIVFKVVNMISNSVIQCEHVQSVWRMYNDDDVSKVSLLPGAALLLQLFLFLILLSRVLVNFGALL